MLHLSELHAQNSGRSWTARNVQELVTHLSEQWALTIEASAERTVFWTNEVIEPVTINGDMNRGVVCKRLNQAVSKYVFREGAEATNVIHIVDRSLMKRENTPLDSKQPFPRFSGTTQQWIDSQTATYKWLGTSRGFPLNPKYWGRSNFPSSETRGADAISFDGGYFSFRSAFTKVAILESEKPGILWIAFKPEGVAEKLLEDIQPNQTKQKITAVIRIRTRK